MEIGASLAQLELFASDPPALAAFYAKTFCLDATAVGDTLDCAAPGRRLALVPGEPGQLRSAAFRFHTTAQFDAQREHLAGHGLLAAEGNDGSYTVRDPEGRLITFLPPSAVQVAAEDGGAALSARLQHFAVRTPTPQALVAFYVDRLGFVLSDRVLDETGELTAAFLRTDAEHHAMAVFRASQVRFDHFSCETRDWAHLRDWADHMAKVGVDLCWGVGRHGPGNDTFFMVRDTEGNLGEISSDLESCEPGRPAGTWPHRPQTLNQWGVALMRS